MASFKLVASIALLVLTSAGAKAGDFRSSVEPNSSVPATPSVNWSGPYVGLQFGYGSGTATIAAAPPISANLTGVTLGGQVGYNFELADKIVAGIEGDLVWNGQQYLIPGSTGAAVGRIEMDGSLRSRLGFDFKGVMPYAEVGIAFANATLSLPGAGSFSATYTGWTAGAGVEAMVTYKISANLEYRYSDLGTQVYDGGLLSLTNSTFRTALNYHF